MGLDKITENIEKVDQVNWMNKSKYLDKDIDFEIEEVYKVDKDVVLALCIPDGQSKPENMRLNEGMRNDIIDHFGHLPGKWIGQGVTISFRQFKPKEGSKMNPGITTAFVWPEETNF